MIPRPQKNSIPRIFLIPYGPGRKCQTYTKFTKGSILARAALLLFRRIFLYAAFYWSKYLFYLWADGFTTWNHSPGCNPSFHHGLLCGFSFGPLCKEWSFENHVHDDMMKMHVVMEQIYEWNNGSKSEKQWVHWFINSCIIIVFTEMFSVLFLLMILSCVEFWIRLP